MPSAAARSVYEDQIPTFMSVFDLDPETMEDRDTVTVVNPTMVNIESKQSGMGGHDQHQQLGHGGLLPTDPSHKHSDSTSTQMSESADSSPTTTLSTTDSSPLSDPSPSSSPDSPVSLVPLNNYPSTTFGGLPNKPPVAPEASETSTFKRPMTSPSPRRPRNMKGLSIQPPSAASTTPTTSLVSEPGSPSFIKPQIPAMKRKPSMLSLKTNTSDLLSKPIAEVPPSPGKPPILQRRALKHSTSSPHMLTMVKSATFGPSGGMTLPNMLARNENGLSEVLRPMKTSMNTTFEPTISEEEPSPIRSQMASRMEIEPYHEKADNEDQKTPGYPDGPIAIYDDNVYLYLEPSAAEASKFDVVINVAKEVQDPFEAAKRKSAALGDSQMAESPVPDTAMSTMSFATAFEFQPGDDKSETPTTPRANPFAKPEYIHMPWDHHTDIAPDLMNLCETIDNRINDGKKVLIHCQQGASRSASLIIAYGLYRRPELSVNDAYYAAQSKSRWISPNMKLMYCLQDFQKELSSKRLAPPPSYRRAGRSPTKHRLTLSADAIDIPHKEPRTAPLPGEEEESRENQLSAPEYHRRGKSLPGPDIVPPGPASAPPNFSWRDEFGNDPLSEAPKVPEIKLVDLPQRPKTELEGRDPVTTTQNDVSFDPPPTPAFAPPGGFVFQNRAFPRFSNQARLSQRPVELGQPSLAPPPPPQEPPPPPPSQSVPMQDTVMRSSAFDDDEAVLSPRVEAMTVNPFTTVAPEKYSTEAAQSAAKEIKDNLFSPRATLFPRDPMAPFGRPSQVADPRSPPTVGETPIVRSIDQIL
jgi:tyrosine-protein phosphatase